jgi:hypothetical protein
MQVTKSVAPTGLEKIVRTIKLPKDTLLSQKSVS